MSRPRRAPHAGHTDHETQPQAGYDGGYDSDPTPAYDSDPTPIFDGDPTPIFPAPVGSPRGDGPLDPGLSVVVDRTESDVAEGRSKRVRGDKQAKRSKRADKPSKPSKRAEAKRSKRDKLADEPADELVDETVELERPVPAKRAKRSKRSDKVAEAAKAPKAARSRQRGRASVLASIVLVAGVGVLGYGVYTLVTSRSDPAETKASPVADGPNETVSAEQLAQLDESLTPTQQRAALAAMKQLELYPTSRTKLVNDLSDEYADERFAPTDAAVAVDSLNVDWNVKALESAKGYLEGSAFSEEGLRLQLSSARGEQFTNEEASYAIDRVEADWDAQAVRYAQLFVDSSGISRVKLFRLMTDPKVGGFTEAQSNAALDGLEVDWNAEAAEAAQDIKSRNDAIGCDDMIDQLWGQSGAGFAPEQARAGAEAAGVC